MGILINTNSKIIIQGFTGKEATFHALQMIEYGTNIVGGVTPYKGNSKHLSLPVFNDLNDAIKSTNPNVSIIFVPPKFSYDAIIEAINYNIELIVVITEGIPINDMILIKSILKKNKSSILIGPNCPGIITVNESKVGIMPNNIFNKVGNIGIISRSGTLTYEVADQIKKVGLGISTAVGIGGDPIIGSSIIDLLKLFNKDPKTESVIIIGEIGGDMEIEAAKWAQNNFNKPIAAFIAGKTAPKGRKMGHAGAVIGNVNETATAKMNIMNEYGIYIIKSIDKIGISMLDMI